MMYWNPMDTSDLTVASVQRTPAISKSPVSLVPEDTSDQYIAGVHRADTRHLLVAGVPQNLWRIVWDTRDLVVACVPWTPAKSKSRVSYSGHRRLVNRRCPAYGHPRFTGRRCPSVKFPGLKVKISTFAAVSPPGSSSWLILRHLRLICSTYLVFGEVWTTAKSKIIQRLKVLQCT